MTRFSLEEEADERGRPAPSNSSSSSSRPSTPKRQKLTISPPSQPAVDDPVETEELIEEEVDTEEEEEEEEEEESEYESGAEEEESEQHEDEEEEQDEDSDDEDEEELENQQQQQPQPLPRPEVNEEINEGGPISVTLTDPDVLDCPICLEPLSVPVFQCENGHTACASCCSKIRNRCPSCCWPIGYNRCRAIEKVLESVKVSCRNVKYGCTQMVKYCHKHEHENTCCLVPCSCPLPDCNFVGVSLHLYAHFKLKHPTSGNTFLFDKHFSVSFKKSQRSIILRESKEAIIFILNHFSECRGSAINVVRIAPPGSGGRFSYQLRARDGDTSIKLQSSVDSIPKWINCTPAKKFLLVPSYYTSTRGQLKLDVCIRKC